MYAIEIRYENTRYSHSGRFTIQTRQGRILKWTVLQAGQQGRELLQLFALTCAGAPLVRRLGQSLQGLQGDLEQPTHLELKMIVHGEWDRRNEASHWAGNAMTIGPGCHDIHYRCRTACHLLAEGMPVRRIPLKEADRAYFSLALGRTFRYHQGSDDFEFTDPYHRLNRLRSLFDPQAQLTDPCAFVERLRHKGIRCRRFPALQMIKMLTDLLRQHLSIDPVGWFVPGRSVQECWALLSAWQQRVLVPILDMARHLLDATPFVGHLYQRPVVLFIDRPDIFCSRALLTPWLKLMDSWLPNAQFVVTLGRNSTENLPHALRHRWLPLPPAPEPPGVSQVSGGTPIRRSRSVATLLVDVDKGRLPNLALMKLSSHLKRRRKAVKLIRGFTREAEVEAVYASCVFSSPASLHRVERLRRCYPAILQVGGTGVDLESRLPREMEDGLSDYDLYPELGDRAIGFLTRGCPHRCNFCVVPRKEGRPRQVSGLAELLQGRRKLILLDDNLLAHPEASMLLAELAEFGVEVNFNQTLDLRYVDLERARLLRRIHSANASFSRHVYYFSLNRAHRFDLVRRKHAMLGFTRQDNVEFICMYGHSTTLAEDVERFRFLRSLPGAYVFVQRYCASPGSPPPRLDHFFDDGNPDALIDELVKILFPQNMKSMEIYYRWLSRRYVETFGRLHRNLVDTIFRYNNREGKGRYIATLAGTRKIRGW